MLQFGGRAGIAADAKIFLDAHLSEKLAAFRHKADAAFLALPGRERAKVLAVEIDSSLVRGKPHDRAQQRRLAGAIGADHGNPAPRRYREVYTRDGHRLTVADMHIFYLEHHDPWSSAPR